MKNYLFRAFCFFAPTLLAGPIAAQHVATSSGVATLQSHSALRHAAPVEVPSVSPVYRSMHSDASPLDITVSGVDPIPLSGTWAYQSNYSRPLHNMQVHPSNPNYIHAVLTDE